MIKRTIEISSGPCRLCVRDGQLQIERKDAESASAPCEDIGVLIIDQPAVTVTAAALLALLEQKAAVVFCGRSHLPEGLLLPHSANLLQAERLRRQVNATLPVKKNLWMQIVRAKIRHQAANLAEHDPARLKLAALAEAVRSGDRENVEAQASRVYWERFFPNDEFRRRREGDAPNNFLNYGYAVLRAAVARALVGAGLHPALGIHHRSRYNPYALADDLMEPFRPMIDARARVLWRRDRVEIDRDVKTGLLAVLTDTVKFSDSQGPLVVALGRMTASFVRCLGKEERKLEIPQPCTFPDGG